MSSAAVNKPSRKLRLVEMVQSNGHRSARARSQLRNVLKEQDSSKRRQFLEMLHDHRDKTEEDLLTELAPTLQKPKTGKKGGRRPGSTDVLQREKLMLAYRLQTRGLTHRQIAEQMQVSVTSVENYLREVRSILRVDPAMVDVPQYIGETLHLYKDLRGMALLIASGVNIPSRTKLAAIQVVLTCTADETAFMKETGILAPGVVQYIQQMVVQNNVVNSGKREEDAVYEFMHKLADDLIKHAPIKGSAEAKSAGPN